MKPSLTIWPTRIGRKRAVMKTAAKAAKTPKPRAVICRNLIIRRGADVYVLGRKQ